jgi:hypothetical protein
MTLMFNRVRTAKVFSVFEVDLTPLKYFASVEHLRKLICNA